MSVNVTEFFTEQYADASHNSSNETDFYIPLDQRPETYFVPVLFLLIFIIGCLGNGTLVVIFLKHKTMRNVPNTIKIKPHELIIIDLKTDQIIHRYSIPDDILTPATTLASITVDVAKDNCDDAYAYFPDLAGFQLVVYSRQLNHAWRVKHNYFYLENTAGEFFIGGFNFQWSDGVFSAELSDKRADGFRDLYFHSLAGTNMYKVSTRILRNESLATRSYHGKDFEIVGNRGANSQTTIADLHKPTGLMFLALVNQNALGYWDTNKPLNTISILHRDDKNLIYPSDVKVYQDTVVALSNSMPIFLYGRLNYDTINFRVWIHHISKR